MKLLRRISQPNKQCSGWKVIIGISSLVVTIVVLVLVLWLLLEGDVSHSSEPEISMSEFFLYECSQTCREVLANFSISSGAVKCNGDKLFVKCNTNFNMIEDKNIECNTVTDQSDLPRCAPKFHRFLALPAPACPPPPQPAHGETSCQSEPYFVGSSCTVKCEHGPVNPAMTSVSCQENLSWGQLPTCQPPPCTALNNKTGSVVCSSDGQHCMTKCAKNNISQLNSCDQNGRWERDLADLPCSPSCAIPTQDKRVVQCGSSKALNQLLTKEGAPRGTSCNVGCQSGFLAVNSLNTMTCNEDGEWSSMPGSCEDTDLVILGGERGGQVTDAVELVSQQCPQLPPLPKKVKLGSAGFVSNRLLVCGGETNLQNQNSDCWVLELGA